MKTKRIIMYSMAIAITILATIVLVIPVASGYVNLGDVSIITFSYLLGPVGGFLAGGLGSAVADLLLGFSYYAPASLIIKGLEGLLAGIIFNQLATRNLKIKTSPKIYVFLLSAIPAGLLMVLGYFLADYILFDFAASLAGLNGNLLQALVGIILSSVLYKALEKTGLIDYLAKSSR